MKCPCKNCPCIAICRLKQFLKLFQDCELIHTYEPKYMDPHNRNKKHMNNIEINLNPSTWKIHTTGGGIPLIGPCPSIVD